MSDPEHVAKLLEGAKAWNDWRQTTRLHPDLSDLNASDEFRRNRNLESGQSLPLEGIDFSWTDLRHTNFYNSDFSNANFYAADLENSNFSHCRFHRANLTSAKLQGTDLAHSDLIGANLTDTELWRAKLYAEPPEHLRPPIVGRRELPNPGYMPNLKNSLICSKTFKRFDVTTPISRTTR